MPVVVVAAAAAAAVVVAAAAAAAAVVVDAAAAAAVVFSIRDSVVQLEPTMQRRYPCENATTAVVKQALRNWRQAKTELS